MKNLVAVVAASAALLAFAPIVMAASPAAGDKSKSTAGAPTSDRSPDKQATTPNSQVDTTANGETSDRTPKNHGANGAASGEQGTGSASNQTWDQTYQSDKAQEQQLKGGGTSR